LDSCSYTTRWDTIPVEGSCRCDGAVVQRIIKPGDIDFVPLGYTASWHDKGPGRIANLRLSPSLMSETATALRQADGDAISFAAQLSLSDRVLRYLTLTLVAELEAGADHGPLFGESVGTAIAAHLLQTYARVKSSPPPARFSAQQISRITEYIDANLAADVSLAEIASVAGSSVSHLTVLFHRSFGLPVHQYVIQQRVERAVRLLLRTNARLCEVAQQAGFTDQSHMTRCMRRLIGTTPAALSRKRRLVP
jgi:AraC family transcriptional regulator